LESVSFDLACAQALGTSYLTDMVGEVDLLTRITQDTSVERRNQIAEQHLTTILPFLADIAVADLVRLRDTEGDAFIVFRNALAKAIDAYASASKTFTERDGKAIYSDIIAPEVAKLDVKVREARRNLIKAPMRAGTAWAGAISFGVYSGILPTAMAAVASALGLVKVAAEITQTVMNLSETDQAVRTADFYFLWRMKRLARPSTD
jgi:hypothetical protein